MRVLCWTLKPAAISARPYGPGDQGWHTVWRLRFSFTQVKDYLYGGFNSPPAVCALGYPALRLPHTSNTPTPTTLPPTCLASVISIPLNLTSSRIETAMIQSNVDPRPFLSTPAWQRWEGVLRRMEATLVWPEKNLLSTVGLWAAVPLNVLSAYIQLWYLNTIPGWRTLIVLHRNKRIYSQKYMTSPKYISSPVFLLLSHVQTVH